MKKTMMLIFLVMFALFCISCGDDEKKSDDKAADDATEQTDDAATEEENDGSGSSSDTTYEEAFAQLIDANCKLMVECATEEEKEQTLEEGLDLSTVEKCKEFFADVKANPDDCPNFDADKYATCYECWSALTCDDRTTAELCKNECSNYCE